MLRIYQRYAPAAEAPTTDYPLGSIKNNSVPGADDGTPLEKDWGNNVEGFHQALMAEAALTASGTPDTAHVSQLLEAVKIVAAKMVYPVGSYYANNSDPTNPATLFGFGTWVRVEGRVLIGCDGTGSGTFGTPGAQGGSTSHTHTVGGTALTIAQMPVHTHMTAEGGGDLSVYGKATGQPAVECEDFLSSKISTIRELTSSAGSGDTHTHSLTTTSTLPPYRVAYLWIRTA